MPYLTVQGIRIYYSVRIGRIGDLVFLHGAGGNHLNWYYQLEYLKNSFNLFAIDLPGHGNSEGVPCDSIPCYTKFLSGFLERIRLTPENLVLIGHSMGGLVIEEYLKNNGTCQGVIFISSSYRIGRRNPPRSPEEFCKNLFYSSDAVGRCLKTADMILERSKNALKHDLEAVSKVDYRDIVRDFDLPFLLIHGDKDRLISLEDAEEMEELLPRATLHVVEDAGHMVMIEKAEEVNNAIKEWVKSLK